MKISIPSLVLGLISFASLNTAFASKLTSDYTSIKAEDCVEIASSEYDDPQEIDHFEEACKGISGYSILVQGGDARSWISVRFNGSEPISALTSGPENLGLFPNIDGEKIEWRGKQENGKLNPFAIIYRVSAQTIDIPAKQLEALAVIRIDRKGACQQAFITGKKMNENARKAADEIAGGNGCEIQPWTTSSAN